LSGRTARERKRDESARKRNADDCRTHFHWLGEPSWFTLLRIYTRQVFLGDVFRVQIRIA